MSCFSFLKIMMFVFNGVIFLGGVVLLGIGIWVKVDSTSFVKVLGAASPHLMHLINVGYLCIAVGIFLLLMGFMGCWGSVKESKCLLLMADIFVEYLEKWAIKSLKVDYGRQTDLTEIWNTTMEEMKCCGFNNYTDFSDSYFFQTYNKYPSPCCPDNKDCQESEIDESKQGCLHEFQVFLSKNGKIVGGVVLGIGALELAAMVASMFLYCKIGTSS